MLYLHGGWPKTGTKSLQAALRAQRDPLAAAGAIYPDRWSKRLLPEVVDGSHNDFPRLLREFESSPSALDGLLGLLSEHAGRDVLISSELIAIWALSGDRADVVQRFFAAVGKAMPVTCVWTLRRYDDFACSLYLQVVALGSRLPAPPEFVARARPDRLFTSMRQMGVCADGVTCVKYQSDGGHQAELLRAFGLPVELRGAIEHELACSPRLNPTFTHKQAVALVNAESLSAHCGVTLERPLLRRLFNTGSVEFDRDGPCALVSAEERRRLRERALESASAAGFDPYVRFFENEEEEDLGEHPDLSPDLLDDDDLARLARACEGARSRSGAPRAPARA